MHFATPYQLFSPIHVAWLYRRVRDGLDVTSADLNSIEAAQPEAIRDALLKNRRKLADKGQLYRRRGRKPVPRARLWAAWCAIQDEKDLIWAERQKGSRVRQRSDDSPIHEAAEKIARTYRFGSGRSLLNLLARHRIPENY